MDACDSTFLERVTNILATDDCLRNDFAYSLSMASASDTLPTPLAHDLNKLQQRQLWLSKTQPLQGRVWIERGGFRSMSTCEEAESASRSCETDVPEAI